MLPWPLQFNAVIGILCLALVRYRCLRNPRLFLIVLELLRSMTRMKRILILPLRVDHLRTKNFLLLRMKMSCILAPHRVMVEFWSTLEMRISLILQEAAYVVPRCQDEAALRQIWLLRCFFQFTFIYSLMNMCFCPVFDHVFLKMLLPFHSRLSHPFPLSLCFDCVRVIFSTKVYSLSSILFRWYLSLFLSFSVVLFFIVQVHFTDDVVVRTISDPLTSLQKDDRLDALAVGESLIPYSDSFSDQTSKSSDFDDTSRLERISCSDESLIENTPYAISSQSPTKEVVHLGFHSPATSISNI